MLHCQNLLECPVIRRKAPLSLSYPLLQHVFVSTSLAEGFEVVSSPGLSHVFVRTCSHWVAPGLISSELWILYNRRGFVEAFGSYLKAVNNGQEPALPSSAARIQSEVDA